jgi:circadian clock protein KaiB
MQGTHAPAPGGETRYRFRLFVAGDGPRSHQAIDNLHRLSEELRLDAEIEVVDVLTSPDVAEAERILTTPTLIRERPAPALRLTGDLSDRATVVQALTLQTGSRARPGEPR